MQDGFESERRVIREAQLTMMQTNIDMSDSIIFFLQSNATADIYSATYSFDS
jgi:hypothetical protein